LAVLAGAVGFVINSLFVGTAAPMLGRVFTLPIAILFGPWVGALSDVPAEGTVFLVRHGTRAGYVLSEGVNPFYSDIDAHAMAQSALDLAVRRQLCAGARPDRIAVLDNFCWPDPVGSPHKMAQLVRACRGLDELARTYGTPLVSGKDSMKNDSTMGGVTISIPPTLLVSAIGRIDDVASAVTLDVKEEGDAVFVLGTTRDETGGSEYFRWRGEREGRTALARACFDFLPHRALLDLAGWAEQDIFAHV